MYKIKWSESVWFFDIDDTLIDTAGTSSIAADGIRKVFEEKLTPQEAKSVADEFNNIFNHMMMGYRVRSESDWNEITGGKEGFQKLLHDIEMCQKSVVDQYGAYKKFSREVFTKIAADRLGIKYSPELIHESADAYWITLTEKTIVFPHALNLIKEIKAHKRPIYLLTSSDARLKLGSDGQFTYIPEYSEGLKRERIELLREKGVDFNIVSIGDPEDKPHRDFFEKGIKKAEEDMGQKINLKNAIMYGDSFAGDLQTPKEVLGFGFVVLFQKERQHVKAVDERQIDTGNLLEASKFLVV